MKRVDSTPQLPASLSCKKKFFIALIFSLVITQVYAQVSVNGNWTFMKGGVEVYGTMGVADSANTPGPRSSSITWTDVDGKLWLFGGQSVKMERPPMSPPVYTYLPLSDLWKYDPGNNMWTWMKGAKSSGENMGIIYGEKGIAAEGNNPGHRYDCYSWTAKDGSFWFYDPRRTEFWKYDIVTTFWTWVKGDASQKNPLYGIKGIPEDQNTPGTKNHPGCWIDLAGNLWLMSGSRGNDLWKYEPASNKWALINGDPFFSENPVYGLRGANNPSNTPGVRKGAATWKDLDGDLWLLGGYILKDGLFQYKYNDLWKYQVGTDSWTWMRGDTLALRGSIFGEKGVESKLGQPGGRAYVLTWEDIEGNFWTMGGNGYGEDDSDWEWDLCELWKFNPGNLKWTWVNSDGDTGAKSFEWMGKEGNLWLMGGESFHRFFGSSYRNDLWRFSGTQPVLANNIISFSAKRKNEYASLQWSVENESDVKGYTLQRKYNNAPGFENIAFISAHNTNNASANYSYKDLNTSTAPSYYRVMQITNAGKEIFSEIRMVEGLKQGLEITVYPNPSSGDAVHVFFNDKWPKNVRLISVIGQVIRRWDNYSANLLTIDNLPQGTYLIYVTGEKNTRNMTRKVVIVK